MALEAVQNPPQIKKIQPPTEQDQVAFLCIDPRFIDNVWDKCSGYIESSFSKNAPSYAIDDVKRNIMTGECQLWVAVGFGRIIAAAVTMLTVEPKAKTCGILHVGGEDGTIRLWVKKMDEAINEFSSQNGCQTMEAVARRGFHHFLRDWAEDGVIYVKKVSHG